MDDAMNRREAVGKIGQGMAALAAASADNLGLGGAQTAPLITRPIPSSGESLPVIGVGTWQTFDVGAGMAERAPREAVLAELVALGGRVIDSSPMYGSSEQVVGEIADKLGLRPKLFVATKVWTSGKRRGIEQMEDSMTKLRAKPIDLLQVHNLVDVETHLATLAEWKRTGRVRYVGITHYTAGAHADVERVAAAHPVDFIQINYSVGEREAERRLLPFARERGIAVIANRPFAGGGVIQRLSRRSVPAWASEIDCTTWAQVLLKFVVSHPAITCAIPGTGKPEHLRDNMRAARGRLPDDRLRARIASEALER